MIDHIDAAREQQSLDRHVAHLMGYATKEERRAYLAEMAEHYAAGFVAKVKAEFLQRWGKR